MTVSAPVRAPKLGLAGALATFKSAVVGTAAMSGVINVLALTGSFFMLQVYDRVIPSRSIPTLIGLGVLAGFLFAFQGLLEVFRSRVLSRIALAMDEKLNGRVYESVMRLPLRAKSSGDGLQPLRDLDQIRSFLSGNGPSALFDLPWMPLYLGICFVFHPWIGLTAVVGAVILIALTLYTEARTREPTRQANALGARRNAMAEADRRNAEVLQAMGFGVRMSQRWQAVNTEFLRAHARASDAASSIGTMSKVVRLALQSFLLAVGAYLVVIGQATGGIMIASSIMMGRALAPIEQAIANWKSFVGARQGWTRLRDLLAAMPPPSVQMELPAPCVALQVEGVTVAPPSEQRAVVVDASFTLQAGSGLGVIGPSASGKSSLARAVVGIWRPARGTVRLDGAALDQWDEIALGRHVGYLPQGIELFGGTVGENISRFDPEPSSEKILAAARAAGVHELVVRLPDGYDTQIGEGGVGLSAGQRQRVGLARALYGDPFLVVLDEPNSNLDAEGEAALAAAIVGVRKRGGIVVVVAHRPSALAGVDKVLVMANGRVQAFGPRDEVLKQTTRPAPPGAMVAGSRAPERSEAAAQPAPPPALKVVGGEGGATS